MTDTNDSIDETYEHVAPPSRNEVADEIEEWVDEARRLARDVGLDPYYVNYWIVSNDEMNLLATYDGFQTRYPHWRWGMKFDKQRKQSEFGGGKIFELVNNDDPAHAFLQRANTIADQKSVVTHVEAHADFFKNNRWFQDDPNAADRLARNAEKIEEIMARPDVDRTDVEKLIDTALCIEDTIDQHRNDADDTEGTSVEDHIEEMDIDESIKEQMFDEEWVEDVGDDEAQSFHDDVLQFIIDNGQRYDYDKERAVEFEDWEREVLEIVRDEAHYFAPQRMTKVMNEGHACVAPDTRVVTSDGLKTMADVVEERPDVSDGESIRSVTSSDIVEDYETVTIETKAGYTLTGSTNHKVRTDNGEWVRLDALDVGDTVEIVGGNDVWSDEYVEVDWVPPETPPTVQSVAIEADCSVSTVYEYQNDGSISDEMRTRVSDAIEAVGWDGSTAGRTLPNRADVDIPDIVDEQFGRYLGYHVAEGMIAGSETTNPNVVQFTNGHEAVVDDIRTLVSECYGVEPRHRVDGSRHRITTDSATIRDFLTEYVGLPDGESSSERYVPDCVFESPRSVVVEFLRGLFSGDGYTGDQGVIYSTKSDELAEQVQKLLLNFGIQSNRTEQPDGCWHVHMTGMSARRFADDIGFVQDEKTEALESYLDDLSWFEDEDWADEVVSIETGTGDVYDITVAETHRYEADGFVNHNSFWETIMMANEGFADDDEFVMYADHHAKVLGAPGLNPYKLGREIWEHIENTTNRQEVVDKLLRVDGIRPGNFHRTVDFDRVYEMLSHPDSYSPEKRNFSLARPENRGVLRNVNTSALDDQYRYMIETDRYETVEEAIADVDYGAGWDRMREIRETHVDPTFIDQFIDEEFIEQNDYFTYDYNPTTDQTEVSSTDPQDVKKKLLLKFTNFGKPTIVAEDDNYNNAGELLLTHEYNGISLDVEQAKDVLERLFEVWGRPVNLRTIVKSSEAEEESDDQVRYAIRAVERDVTTGEQGYEFRYDGESFEEIELDDEIVEYIRADEIDYETRPEEWL